MALDGRISVKYGQTIKDFERGVTGLSRTLCELRGDPLSRRSGGVRAALRFPAAEERSGLNAAGRPSRAHAANGLAQAADEAAEPLWVLPAGGEWATAMGPLDRFVGLRELRSTVEEICAYAAVQKARGAMSLNAAATAQHMLFTGRPGTGKTSVAREMGRMLRELRVLSQGHLVEVERADLVGEYVGHTAQRTRAVLGQAQGGILFVDEAYSLGRGGERDFGREAVDTMVKAMEDVKDDLVVILAGYPDEMQRFLSLNPGLRSRLPISLDFPDFSDAELLEIARQMTCDRDYRMTQGACEAFCRWMERERRRPEFANARTVRNLVERAMRRQALRLVRSGGGRRDALMQLTADDFFDPTAQAPGAQSPYLGARPFAAGGC